MCEDLQGEGDFGLRHLPDHGGGSLHITRVIGHACFSVGPLPANDGPPGQEQAARVFFACDTRAPERCNESLATSKSTTTSESCRLLDRMVPAPAAREPAAVVEAIDDEIAGDEEGPPPALEPARVPERVAVVEVVGADVAGDCVGEAVAKALVEVPRDIMGQAVKRVRGRDSGGWSYRDRIAISCRNPAHTSCSKSRSLALDLDVFGPTAAVIFLSTWLSLSDTDERIHKKMVPTRAEMRAFISKSAE